MTARPERSAEQALADSTPIIPSFIDFGRETCCLLNAASDREWLVTNGIGGFASGTVVGVIRHLYHGLPPWVYRPRLDGCRTAARLDSQGFCCSRLSAEQPIARR